MVSLSICNLEVYIPLILLMHYGWSVPVQGLPVQFENEREFDKPLILTPETKYPLHLFRMKLPYNDGDEEYYADADSEEYDEDDDDDDNKMVVVQNKHNKFEKIEDLSVKIYSKFLDKYLHIKSDKPPDPPKWALNMNTFGPVPDMDIEPPPWHTVLNTNTKAQ